MKVDDPARRRRPLGADDDDEVGDGGLAKVARGVGRAFGVFRRLGPKERAARPRKKVADSRAERGAVRAALHQRAPVDAERRTAALQQQIREIESELEPLYHLIAHGRTGLGRTGLGRTGLGRSGHAAAGDGRRELADLVQHARSLKEALQEKRLELARVQRRAARDRLLAVSGPGRAPAEEPQEPPPRSPRGRWGGGEAGPPQRMRQAVQRASKKSSVRDQPRELIFDKTARGLLDEDPDIRRTAALRLGELEDRAASGLLEAALEDREDKVRVAAMNALAKIGDPAAARVFSRHVDDDSPHARLAALRGLAKVGGAEAAAPLVAALEDDAPAVRKTVATLLGWRGSAGVTVPLVLALRDEDDEVRAAAAASLAALRDDRAVLPLIRALGDEAAEVRAAARRSLRALVGEDLEVPRNTDPAEHIAQLKAWWIEARVTKAIAQIGMPLLPDETLDEPAIPESAVPRRPAPPEEPSLPAPDLAAAAAAAPQPEPAPAPEPAPTPLPREAPDEVPAGAESLDGLLPEEPPVGGEPEGLDDLLPAEEEQAAAPAGGDGEAAAAEGDEEGFEDLLGGGDEDLDSLVSDS